MQVSGYYFVHDIALNFKHLAISTVTCPIIEVCLKKECDTWMDKEWKFKCYSLYNVR